jgi:pantetheine-phosphate adenylyltransferase
VVVRGLRSAADFDAEARMAFTNRLAGGVETVFLPAAPAYAFHTARLIREIALGGGDVSAFVPKAVARRLSRRAAEAEGRR